MKKPVAPKRPRKPNEPHFNAPQKYITRKFHTTSINNPKNQYVYDDYRTNYFPGNVRSTPLGQGPITAIIVNKLLEDENFVLEDDKAKIYRDGEYIVYDRVNPYYDRQKEEYDQNSSARQKEYDKYKEKKDKYDKLFSIYQEEKKKYDIDIARYNIYMAEQTLKKAKEKAIKGLSAVADKSGHFWKKLDKICKYLGVEVYINKVIRVTADEFEPDNSTKFLHVVIYLKEPAENRKKSKEATQGWSLYAL